MPSESVTNMSSMKKCESVETELLINTDFLGFSLCSKQYKFTVPCTKN